MLQELLQEITEADSIECFFHPRHQFSVGDTHCSQEAHLFAGGRMQEDGVRFFRWNPHGTTGSILLEVTFVQAPKVDVIADGESKEFFYMSPAAQDRHAPEAGEVFAVETPAHGKASGIDGRRYAPYKSGPNDD